MNLQVHTMKSLNHRSTLGKSLFIAIIYISLFSITYANGYESVLSDQAMLRKEKLQSVHLEAGLSVTIQGETNSADCILKMGGRDSLSMEISGPFGISVARLFANSGYFLFHDMLQGRAIEGIPNQEQLSEVTFMPLSFDDYTSLLRAEPPGDPLSFALVESFSDSTKLLYKRSISAKTIEYILCVKESGIIKEYQRKNTDGSIELAMIYDGYSLIDGISMPSIVTLSAPSRGLQMTVSAEKIMLNEKLPALQFKLPSSITPLRME
jgi:hypothetical protein